jgi:hypothetical protein
LVDLQTISLIAQIVGVSATATSVAIGVRSYVNNNKRTQEARQKEKQAREIDLCRVYLNEFTSEYGNQRYATVMNMQWTDYNNFMEKYGYTEKLGYSNPEIFGKWLSMLLAWETLGYILKNKIAPAETLFYLGAWGCIRGWDKFKEIIIIRRRIPLYGPNYLANFEFLTKEMMRVKQESEGFDSKLVWSENK